MKAKEFTVPKDLGTHLDALRGLGALAVLGGHFRNIFFVDHATVEHKNILVNLFYFLTGFGHEAVLIFFVLSGLLISKSFFTSYFSGRWSWKEYLLQRTTRLYIVLIPALLLGFFWDHLGMYLFGKVGIYSGSALYGNVVPADVSGRSDFITYLGNFLFLQNIQVNPAGSNNALWSLSFEFWYYILFPCLALTLLKRTPLTHKILHLFLFGFLSYHLRYTALPNFLIWGLGVLSLVLPLQKFFKVTANFKIYTTLLFLLFLVFLFLTRMNTKPLFFYQPGSDFLLSFSLSILLYLLRHSESKIKAGSLYPRISKFFSSFSYTLYLTHLPIAVFLSAAFVTGARRQPTLLNFIFVLALCLSTICYSYLFYLVTENQTDKLRALLKRTKLTHSVI